MARPPRLDYAGARHHVMNRTQRREAMFTDDAVCVEFLHAVSQVPTRFGARIHGYALMPNHYHLMVEVPRGNLSEVMRHIGAVFTQVYNRERGHDGAVFRGRFKNRLVEDDAYWRHLLTYLHLNPVRAALAKRPQDCLWTSYNAYTGQASRPDWLTCDALIGLYGSPEALVDYTRDVRGKRRNPPTGFDAQRMWIPTVSEEAPRPAPPRLRTADEALAEVSDLLGVPSAKLMTLKRGRAGNTHAWLAVWWVTTATELTQAEVAGLWKMSRPRISQLRTSLFERATVDSEVSGWMAALEAER